MIVFNGKPIPGTFGPVRHDPPQLQVVRTKFFGVKGTSEILGESGPRPLWTEGWLHNKWSNEGVLQQFLRELDKLVGTHGELVISGSLNRTFRSCTFEGFRPHERGPMPDVSGTVGSWWCQGVLQWTQLSVHED